MCLPSYTCALTSPPVSSLPVPSACLASLPLLLLNLITLIVLYRCFQQFKANLKLPPSGWSKGSQQHIDTGEIRPLPLVCYLVRSHNHSGRPAVSKASRLCVLSLGLPDLLLLCWFHSVSWAPVSLSLGGFLSFTSPATHLSIPIWLFQLLRF